MKRKLLILSMLYLSLFILSSCSTNTSDNLLSESNASTTNNSSTVIKRNKDYSIEIDNNSKDKAIIGTKGYLSNEEIKNLKTYGDYIDAVDYLNELLYSRLLYLLNESTSDDFKSEWRDFFNNLPNDLDEIYLNRLAQLKNQLTDYRNTEIWDEDRETITEEIQNIRDSYKDVEETVLTAFHKYELSAKETSQTPGDSSQQTSPSSSQSKTDSETSSESENSYKQDKEQDKEIDLYLPFDGVGDTVQIDEDVQANLWSIRTTNKVKTSGKYTIVATIEITSTGRNYPVDATNFKLIGSDGKIYEIDKSATYSHDYSVYEAANKGTKRDGGVPILIGGKFLVYTFYYSVDELAQSYTLEFSDPWGIGPQGVTWKQNIIADDN